MRRLTLHAAVALVTCLIGMSAARLWSAASTIRTRKAVPAIKQEVRSTADSPNQRAEQEILEIIRQYDLAQSRHDAAFFEKTEADSFVLTVAGGKTLAKAQDIADMMTWPTGITYTSDDLHVQFYGNAAIVTGRMTATRVGEKNSYSPRWRWIHLFVKRDGRWQILSTTQVD